MIKRAEYLAAWFFPFLLGLFWLGFSALPIRAETVDLASTAGEIDLSTLAISDEFGGQSAPNPDPESNPEVEVPNNSNNQSGASSNSENQFTTSQQANQQPVSGENQFTSRSVITSETLAISQEENQFSTQQPSSGGGGGGGGGGSTSGGGGGNGGGGGSRRQLPTATVSLPAKCQPFLLKFIKFGQPNDPWEVRKLQSFLRVFEDFELAITGIYDQPTYEAVRIFQRRYGEDILNPWGISEPTGYVYITTMLTINRIYCHLDTANDLDLRLKRSLESGRPESTESAVGSDWETIQGTTTPFEFIGPRPDEVGNRSFWQLAGVGILNLWRWLDPWLNLFLIILVLIFYLLWQRERRRVGTASGDEKSSDLPIDDQPGPKLFDT